MDLARELRVDIMARGCSAPERGSCAIGILRLPFDREGVRAMLDRAEDGAAVKACSCCTDLIGLSIAGSNPGPTDFRGTRALGGPA